MPFLPHGGVEWHGTVRKGAEMAQTRRRTHARVSEAIGAHVTEQELEERLAEGDAEVALTSFEGLELADVDASGATFSEVVFKHCTFERVDFSQSTFTDVIFSGCRFISCTMERSWLNRVDIRSTSAPGMSLAHGRLTGVGIVDSQLTYADFSEASISDLHVQATALAESVWQAARLKRTTFADCSLTRAEFVGTSLAGIDLSSCEIGGIVVSNTFRELRGLVVSPEQAQVLVGLLGVRIARD